MSTSAQHTETAPHSSRDRERETETHTHTHSTPLTGKHDQTDDKDETGVLQSRRSDASGDFDDVTEGKERVEHASKARKRPHCRPPPSGQRQWGRAGLPPPLQAPQAAPRPGSAPTPHTHSLVVRLDVLEDGAGVLGRRGRHVCRGKGVRIRVE